MPVSSLTFTKQRSSNKICHGINRCRVLSSAAGHHCSPLRGMVMPALHSSLGSGEAAEKIELT